MKPGTKPQGKVKIKWSSNFAYAIGLIATDGCLSGDGRHIEFTSKDQGQVENFKKCLKAKQRITKKARGGEVEKRYYRIQIGDVLFWQFLESIGLTPAKSKTMGKINVPSEYFFDFLRGLHDGDGTFYSYFDPRWKSSFMFYLEFISASPKHISWLREELKERLGVWGHVTKDGRKLTGQLKYAKKESLVIIKSMYKRINGVYLVRKKLKIQKALGIIGHKLG